MKLLKFVGYTIWILVSIAIALVLIPLSIALMCTIILAPVGIFMFIGTSAIVSAPFLALRQSSKKEVTLV